MKLGDNILKLRKKKGLSQEQLGEKIDVTRQTISNWELGETFPNPEQLKLLSKELNVSIDELLDNDIQNILVEKVSNTEKLAGLILKIIKWVLIGIPALILLYFILLIAYRNLFRRDTGREIEETIHCKLYGEEHGYSIAYEELTGKIIAEGGDSYFDDILGLSKYEDAHQIFNIINDYVKKNGGTCEMLKDRDLNDIMNIYIKEGTLSKTGATVVITLNGEYDITYGEAFWIEKYNSKIGDYEKIDITTEDGCVFNDIGYIAEEGKSHELKQDWSCNYGELPKGLYRLVKNVIFDADVPVSEDDMYYIWVEFEIE
ncbi:MAG: helix-turn-helix transcriptional regulator [Bacilli bacterium]|nr:helix-turn-helix transcriptional regulator [Bacilli bacterium]